MKKYFYVASKVVMTLILLMPILGITGMLGEPTPELYNTPEAYDFIMVLTDLGIYINYALVTTAALAIIAMWTGRTALAALLALPISVNVVGFHLFLDGGLFTMGAFLGNVLALINVYLIFEHRKAYQPLLDRRG
jgi:hypothetical protein